MCSEIQNKNVHLWEFERITKEITELFPNLEKEVVEEAIKLIPYRKD